MEQAPQKDNNKKPLGDLKLSKPLRLLRTLFALAFWGFAATQLLIFDVEAYLRAHFPNLDLIFQYKFLAMLSVIGVLLLALGYKRFLLFFGYILFYPIIVTVWILPRTLFKNWAVVIAFYPAIHSIFKSFKYNLVLFAAALISAFTICFSPYETLLIVCMVYLFSYLILHYVRRFRLAFSPSTVFAEFGRRLTQLLNHRPESLWGALPEGEPGSETYQQQLSQKILGIYMVSTALHFVGEKIREVIRSRKLDLYFIGTLVYTVLITTLIFSLEYFGLERVLVGSFIGVVSPGFLDFLGYSFSTLMTSEISPLRSNNNIALALSLIETFCSLLIIVLLVFLVLTTIRERYRQDLDSVVDALGDASRRSGEYLEQNFDLTLAAAELWLIRFNPAIIEWILKIRYGEEAVKRLKEEASRSEGEAPTLPGITESTERAQD